MKKAPHFMEGAFFYMFQLVCLFPVLISSA
ncbi:hypothetical protein MED121_19434 [Marinomonas sp. MED121]|nr:hypothetical protein MED121_19434 [Marinomonas sp. MED121]